MARILAKGLNCLDPIGGFQPCNKCEICMSINAGKLVDMIEIDAASNRGIDEIRELREKIVFAPSQAKTKVYIIDEVHMLTKEAFNALLKTLEEPPSHAYFVLATTEAHKIPETIISRCQQFSFNRISVNDITERLNEILLSEGGSAEKEAVELIAILSAGGLRDAIGLLEQMMTTGKVTVEEVTRQLGLTGKEYLETFFNYLVDRKALKAIELLSMMKAKGQSMSQFIREIVGYMREQMLINLGNSHETATIVGFIDIFLQAKQQIDLSPIPELPIEMAIVKACKFEISDEFIEISASEDGHKISPDDKAGRTSGVLTKTISEKTKPAEAKTEDHTTAVTTALDLSRIKKDWNRVLESIDTPFIKMSLQGGQPLRYEGEVLTISFESGTFLEKISSGANQAVVQDAFEKIYGKKLSLNLETGKIDLSLKKKDKMPKEKGASAVEMATEVFGISKK